MTMKAFETISLILPSYNEAARIVNTVNEAVVYFEKKDLDYEIIVAADGDDGTRELAARMGLLNPRLKANGNVERRGTRYGIRHVVAMACGEIIGFADADNKTPLQNWLKSSIGLSKGTISSRSDISGFPPIMVSVVSKPNTKGQ